MFSSQWQESVAMLNSECICTLQDDKTRIFSTMMARHFA